MSSDPFQLRHWKPQNQRQCFQIFCGNMTSYLRHLSLTKQDIMCWDQNKTMVRHVNIYFPHPPFLINYWMMFSTRLWKKTKKEEDVASRKRDQSQKQGKENLPRSSEGDLQDGSCAWGFVSKQSRSEPKREQEECASSPPPPPKWT